MATTTADPLTRKYERVFKHLDADGNGYLERSDFASFVDRLAKEYKLTKNDQKVRAISTAFDMLWHELVRHADTNHDNRISEEEYISSVRRTVDDTTRFNATDALANSLFDIMDVDDDGQISKDEFIRLQQNVWGISVPDAIDTFIALDTDGDGHMSRQEAVRGCRQYFNSNSLDEPGSWFFGRF
ncbi:EF-hand domain-containing protein [Streptomyces sp. NPDC026659]|uniref:EF-hand domain-containing protein n=1 Tax=Streptomyces sp. NPDC026659 TaxID=3155123 RepID=UPI0033ED8F07